MVGRTIPNNDEISNALCSLYGEVVLWQSGPSPDPSWPFPLEGVSKCKYHFDDLTVWNNPI